MTIRERLTKQIRLCMGAAFAGWLLFALFGVIGVGGIRNPIVAVGTFAIFGAAVVYATLFIKCPRCDFKLAQGSMGIAFGKSGPDNKRSVNFCAHCGVNFDERV